MQSDIIIHPGPGPEKYRKGRIISAECHIETKTFDTARIRTEDQLLEKIWPDWATRVCDFINEIVIAKNDPAALFAMEIGQIIKAVYWWLNVQPTEAMVEGACQFHGGRLAFTTDRPNEPVHFSAGDLIKSVLLFVLAEQAKKQ